MPTQESAPDLDEIKQAFAEILLRRKTEADAAAEAAAATGPDDGPDGPDGPDHGDEHGDAQGGAGPGVAGQAEQHQFGSPAWRAFLAVYGHEWDGKKTSWNQFRGWIEIFARERGLSDEAVRFLNAAEAEQDEAARVKVFAKYGVTLELGKIADDTPDKPTADADGRPVDTILSTEKDSDSGGDYLWVRVAGEVGKIYLDGRKFVAEAHPELSKIPAKDSNGRPITEVQPGKAGSDYTVRIGDVWGRLNPANGLFVALRVDESAFADWSVREIDKDGYVEDDITMSGEWFKPWPDQSVYLFRRLDGGLEWAKGDQLVATTEGTNTPTVEKLVRDWAKQYPDEL